MKVHKLIMVSIIAVVLSSCNSAISAADQSAIPTPNIGADIEVGEFLEVTAPTGWNSFKTNEDVSLEIRNISEYPITSGPDFGMRIFVHTDKGWTEVKNKADYEYELITLEPTENYDPLKTVGTLVIPDLPNYSVTSDIRIFVFGDLLQNGKESKKIASYIDLKLNP